MVKDNKTTPLNQNSSSDKLSTHTRIIQNGDSSHAQPPPGFPDESLKGSEFTRIEADHYPFHHYRVQSLLKLLKKAQRLELSLQDQKLATFLISENNEREVYGGAVLFKKRHRNYHKDRSSKFAFQGERLLTASFVLHVPNKDPLYMSGRRMAFCRQFYEELYREFFKIGRERGIPYMWITLDPEEASCLELLCNFPFMLHIRPKDTIDGLFHGLLALEQESAKTFMDLKRWRQNPFPKGGEL